MWILICAVGTASLLGSMHCVGMCGPLALWASGSADSISRAQMGLATCLYHLGRLFTYALAGAVAGMLGAWLGTVPALVGLVVGARSLAAPFFRRLVPAQLPCC